jgi:Zn-dependent protease with chaperone function
VLAGWETTIVRLPHLLTLSLGLCSAACSLVAQDISIAEVTLKPSVRGNLSVAIRTWDAPDMSLGTLRRAAFPCDWKGGIADDDYIHGDCRHYLTSDGTSASGKIDVAPLIVALRAAGIESIRVLIEDERREIAQPPAGWFRETPEIKARRKGRGRTAGDTYWFRVEPGDDLPKAFVLRVGMPWSATQTLVPIGFTLFGPALLALWLRRRADRSGALESAAVWVHWILTATWLYWIYSGSTSNIAGLLAHLKVESMFASLVIGAFLLVAPPLFAVATCVAILMRSGDGDAQPQDTLGLVRRAVLRESVLMVPLSIFMAASTLDQDWKWATIALPVAYVIYRLLSWYVGRLMTQGLEILTRGELMDTASDLASRAGVKLTSVYVLGNRNPREANAFAARDNMMAVTRGLVENLTRRELSAVIGHEVGHIRGKHVGMSTIAFWAYIILMQPLTALLVQYAHVPGWFLSLPIVPLGYIFGTSFLSRRNEYNADGRAVEITGDPEAMIAALARLRRLTRMPVNWGGMQGSILSHPSMRDRVLSIARRSGLAEDRALALLEDRDLLTADIPPEDRHFSLPEECAGAELAFSSTAKASYLMWAGWADQVALTLATLAVCTFADRVWPRFPFSPLAIVASIPLLAATYLIFSNWLGRRFTNGIHRRLERRMGPAAAGGTFVGLLPGANTAPVEGFYQWDVGFLWLTANELVYRGERVSFSIARDSVRAITIRKGPRSWDRAHLVRVECEGGAMHFSRPDVGTTRRVTGRLERRLQSWLQGTVEATGNIGHESPPPASVLCSTPSAYLRGWRAARMFAVRACLLFIGILLVMPLLERGAGSFSSAFVPFVTPLAFLAAVIPVVFRPKPQAEPVAAPEIAPALVSENQAEA